MEVQNRQRAIEALELLQHLLLSQEPQSPAMLTTSQRRALLAQNANHAIALRRKRRALLGTELAAEPCWEILLTLYATWVQDARISVTDVAYETGIPTATVVRWLAVLVQREFVCREPDPRDGRRIWLRLTGTAVAAVEQVLTVEAFSTPERWREVARAA